MARSRSLENIPPSQRPRHLPLFPAGWIYFRRWHSLRWFLMLLVPILQSVVGAIVRAHIGSAFGIAVIGAVVTAALVVVLASGSAFSNWGTFFRSREPVRYWLDVTILSLAYVGLSIAGWFIR